MHDDLAAQRRMLKSEALVLGAVFTGMVWIISPQTAHALSPGCTSLKGFTSSPTADTVSIISKDMVAGEIIAFDINVSGSGGPADITITAAPVGVASPSATWTGVIPFNGSRKATYKVPVSGVYSFDVNVGGSLITLTTGCSKVRAKARDRRKEARDANGRIARTTARQQDRLVKGRMNFRQRPDRRRSQKGGSQSVEPRPNPRPESFEPLPGSQGSFTGAGDTQEGLLAPFDFGQGGAAGGESLDGIGLWANVAWTGVSDTSAVAQMDGDTLTAIAGGDYDFGEGLIAGVALSMDVSMIALEAAGGDMDEWGIGLTPYISYQFDDRFSVSAVAGYSRTFADIDYDTGEKGDFTGQRYFLSGSVGVDEYMDDFHIGGAVGVLWSQSFTSDYDLSDGTAIDSAVSNLGSLFVEARPSYLITLDEEAELWVEPYGLVGFNWDFIQTEVDSDAHPNDNDDFTVGGGVRLYSGSDLSFDLGAQAKIGRQDYEEISASGTFRWQF